MPAKTIDIYVFDVNLSAPGLTPSTEFVDTWYPAPDITMTTSDTAGVEITASLVGSGMPEIEYDWATPSGIDPTVEIVKTGAKCTVKPKAAGMTYVKVYVKYNGTTVMHKNVHITVAGIVFTTCPASLSMDAATSSCSVVAEVQGFSGTPTNWQWNPGTSGHVSFNTSSQINSGTSSSITMNGLSGGPATISVSAVVNGITVSATKEVYIMQLPLSCADSSFT